jgi:hypothetical protein
MLEIVDLGNCIAVAKILSNRETTGLVSFSLLTGESGVTGKGTAIILNSKF